MLPQRMLHTIEAMQQSRQPLHLNIEFLKEALSMWTQAATVDQAPPSSFLTVAWRVYLETVQSNSYFFSTSELALMCDIANVNVAIFKHMGDTLHYHDGVFDKLGRIICVKLLSNDIGEVHSHFERILTHQEFASLLWEQYGKREADE